MPFLEFLVPEILSILAASRALGSAPKGLSARFAAGPSARIALLLDYSLVEAAARSVRRDMAELVAG